MRYQSWDVLVFPDQSKIPLQEFKTACQVVQDQESHISQTSPHLLPTVTSFIPGLPQGAPFRISIHSWQNPEVSRYVQNLNKGSDHIMFEARIFIDGRIAGSKWFDQGGPWPEVIDLSMDLDKHGEFEKLKFPDFHKELLSQSYWNAGDDLGRIKVIIAEGFSRDNLTYAFERAKNIVSFSFQHAPLDVLESSSIAWPNAAMWRQVPLVGPYMGQQFSPRQADDTIDAHSHSPRHGAYRKKPAGPNTNIGSMFPPPPLTSFPKPPTFDPFTESVNSAFTGWRQASNDVAMPDYSTSNTRSSGSRNISDPMIISENKDRRLESMQMPGAYESLCEGLITSIPAAPVNTPQNETSDPSTVSAASGARQASVTLEMVVATIANPTPAGTQPSIPSNVKGKKENAQASPFEVPRNPMDTSGFARKISQQTGVENSNKRQRVITPAASKVIDDEDEPRSSPSLRKSSTSRPTKQELKDNERRVLSGIENI
ncbi:hypothetical protein LSUE1_G003008 [Lachnellula suecica]|uniref:Uncharacterized protein n=1 Tax=Lachnellula suecica TaxID=602035 RepID=A0A8T9C926_9HELO|nr:hypothetical protein LSUE1_G003008 [Lachnellula suecica]